MSRAGGTGRTGGTVGTQDSDDLLVAGSAGSVLPGSASRSIWLAALWTGVGTALVCGVGAIAAVAVCWLPASGSSGSAGSAIRAGVLTFLAGLHAGITVSGLSAQFVPLGLTLLIGAVLRRAGAGLADVAADLDERTHARLLGAALLQAASFALVCTVAAAVTSLGGSRVPVAGVPLAALVLAAVFALPAFVSLSALAEPVRAALPGWVAPAARAAAAVVFCYLAAGAVLTGFALVIHHGRVTAVSAELGSSWAAVPIVLLQVLTVPNAAVAGGAYLAGPGFALGTGDHVSALTTGHGLLPAFPILGAAPTGHGATWPVWVLMSLTALLAATAAARTAWRSPSPWPVLGGAAALATLGGSVLAWQSGGGIGSGRLGAIGASPWQLGLAWGAVTAVGGGVALVFAIVARSLRQRDEQHMPAVVRVAVEAVTSVTSAVSAIVEADQAPVAEQQPTAEPIAEREERRAG